jgi:hypothetical protein
MEANMRANMGANREDRADRVSQYYGRKPSSLVLGFKVLRV